MRRPDCWIISINTDPLIHSSLDCGKSMLHMQRCHLHATQRLILDIDLSVSFMVLLIIWLSIEKSEQMTIYVSFIVCKLRIGRFIIIHCNRANNQTKTPCYSMKYRKVWQHIGNSRPSVTCRNKIKGLELHQLQATGGK